jgi:hypothetical protein
MFRVTKRAHETNGRRLLLAIGWVAAAGLSAAACGSDDGAYGDETVEGTPDASVFPATGGAPAGTGGTAAATGGGAPIGSTGGQPSGSCNPAFCPDVMGGVRCCVAANGPCGVDLGNGCVSAIPNDGGP